MKKLILIACLGLFKSVFPENIEVPINHHFPDKEHFDLYYEFGAAFDEQLPTVIVVADAQQFFVRKGRVKKIQEQYFGEGINVLGIVTRGNNKSLRTKAIDKNNNTNWSKAYELFNAFQYVSDIEFVRKHVLKNEKSVFLYGNSGGSFLISEYLSVFPESPISKVFMASCVSLVLEQKIGTLHDNFQRDFLKRHPLAKTQIDSILQSGVFNREEVCHLLQRQNFFVDLDYLDHSRIALINHLYNQDTTSINRYKKDYQINGINEYVNSEYGIPIKVRIFEFIAPLLKSWQPDPKIIYPELESSYNVAKELIALMGKNKIAFKPYFKPSTARGFKGEVFILSASHDHVADYRTSIYLSAIFKNSNLFLCNDNHMFMSLKNDQAYARLVQDFLLNTSSDHLWLDKYESYRWKER